MIIEHKKLKMSVVFRLRLAVTVATTIHLLACVSQPTIDTTPLLEIENTETKITASITKNITSDIIDIRPQSKTNNINDTKELMVSYYWTLDDIKEDSSEMANKLKDFDDILMVVGDDAITLKLCHTFSSRYVVAPDNKHVFYLTPSISSYPLCSETVQNFEIYLDGLMLEKNEFHINKIDIDRAILTQTTQDGEVLKWCGEMTESAKYGEGETLIWEVDKDTYPCKVGSDVMCLKIRDVYYDKDMNKKTYSEWRLFPQKIRWFDHHQGAQTVLIIKKYVPETNGEPIYVLEHIREWFETGDASAMFE